MDLETRYRAYLQTLNERRLDDLDQHVHDEITYNARPLTRREYQDLIAADVAAIPDLHYDAELIVADDDHIACRLLFRCTPQDDFLGFSPNGQRLVFAEHVFYRYREGRIAEVTSLIDRWSIREQLQTGRLGATPEYRPR
jgi:predicted ester cyclase